MEIKLLHFNRRNAGISATPSPHHEPWWCLSLRRPGAGDGYAAMVKDHLSPTHTQVVKHWRPRE